VLYHFDPTGLNLSKTQSGQLKAIQGGKGYPDLFIIERNKDGKYNGLFLEIKAEGTRLLDKTRSNYANDHLTDQAMFLYELSKRGFKAEFGVGFDECMKVIDNYLRNSS
jgi:hypothetical protein